MTMPSNRPALLQNARNAVAYQRWLEANALYDSDANAWRFVAEAGLSDPDSPDAALSAVGEHTTRRRKRVAWTLSLSIGIPLLLIGFAGVLLVAYAINTAEHWTKIDVAEESHGENVSLGTWHVTMDDKDVCYVGQDWQQCIAEHTDQWNFACAEITLDTPSRELCDNYYDMIQTMRTDGAGQHYSTVATLGSWGRLSLTENMTRRLVIDTEEVSHRATCYLGFLGECE